MASTAANHVSTFSASTSASISAADIVYKTYLKCPIQKRSLKNITAWFQKTKLLWVHMGDDKNASKEIDPTSPEFIHWMTFIVRIVTQLKLFGFAVYKMNVGAAPKGSTATSTVRRKKTTPLVSMEVANGQNVTLKWAKSKWIINSIAGNDDDKNINSWELIIMDEPNRIGISNIPILNSSAANCQKNSNLYFNIKKHIEHRDQFNSNPTVYTSISKNIVSNQNGTWFNNAGNSHIDAPGITQDFTSVITDRLNAIKELDKMSNEARLETRLAYSKKSLNHCKQQTPAADELLITDGKDYKEVSHRRAPEELHQLLDRLTKEIMFTYEVSPQAFGIGGSSERLTSNDRLAQIGINNADEHKHAIMEYVQFALKDISSKLSKDKSGNTWILIKPRISYFNFQQVKPFLKPKFAIKTMSILFNIPEDEFDATLYENHIENEFDRPKKLQRLTDEQKQDRRDESALP